MPNACGMPVHKPLVSLWVPAQLSHNPARELLISWVKPRGFIHTFAQFAWFLYTVSTQLPDHKTSVKRAFVHIFHRAYKDIGNLKKGII